MKLNAWLEATGKAPSVFARDIGVEASTIHRLIRRERRPSHELMRKIADATSGAVRPDDFFDVLPAGDAA